VDRIEGKPKPITIDTTKTAVLVVDPDNDSRVKGETLNGTGIHRAMQHSTASKPVKEQLT
jgi:hypothetical protein